ncbi:helix-turn-helix transcriptional regulator [Aliidongia dinghuensis]|nr:helix-turn-helix transcriptional regulator [Aliidongia dinghuensis]
MIATPAQIKAARALLGWSTEDLAERMGLARNSITRLENESLGTNPSGLARATAILEAAGVIFIARDIVAGDGVRLAGPRAPYETQPEPEADTGA